MKKCSMCSEIKDYSEFKKRKDSSDGYRNECKECFNHKRRKYDGGRRDIIRVQYKEWYYSNREIIIEKMRKYHKENLSENKRVNNSLYRALKKSTSDGTINIVATQQLLDEQGGVCNICGIDITDRTTRHLDHIKPLSKGGLHSIDNVQWLCAECNLIKSDKYENL